MKSKDVGRTLRFLMDVDIRLDAVCCGDYPQRKAYEQTLGQVFQEVDMNVSRVDLTLRECVN